MSKNGPTGGVWRDEAHKTAKNGAKIEGKWIAIDWQWDGKVRDYEHDGGWHFQIKPPGTEDDEYYYWNAAGNDKDGYKTEHLSPDPRAGKTGFVQGSTAGYFGHYYVENILGSLAGAGDFPAMFNGTYYVYQGEQSIEAQIELGGKGQYADGKAAIRNYSGGDVTETSTFEDIDGLEIFAAKDGNLYAMIQEDSGNNYGERMFITGPLEHDDDGEELTYYFVAMSGGDLNTRMVAGVGIPAGVNTSPRAHEFSGLFDMSGLLRKDGKDFALEASDSGFRKREEDAKVGINDKYIMVGLQSHNFDGGVIGTFGGDRGGQWLCYQPNIPV